MITLNFYNNTSPELKVGKTLTLVTTMQGDLLNDCSVVDPVFRIASQALPQGNYVECTEFGMKYFIRDKKYIGGTAAFWDITCECDPRETCAAQIRAQSAILERSETVYNANLVDNELPLTARTETKTYKIGDPVNKQHYMLLAANSYLGGTA